MSGALVVISPRLGGMDIPLKLPGMVPKVLPGGLGMALTMVSHTLKFSSQRVVLVLGLSEFGTESVQVHSHILSLMFVK